MAWTRRRWWPPSILAAVSESGSAWSRLGPVLEAHPDELAVFEPWVVPTQRRFSMFFVSDDGRRPTIQLATSKDGISWDRRGITLPGSDEEVDTLGERSPCLLRLRDGTLRLWFAAKPMSNVDDAYRLYSADFTERDEWLLGE
jgi:hypothetical protein